ncbi:acyltransferase family protein [Serratia quinivorans]|uniref:acyltransferase family protein n=1 Tax=Serratia quinivorans TaxID=137545 RepID=UPI00217C7A87|nr:acyltransferase family protein [Serratia quinivorans]CAI0896240.1 O-acetyltransferase OatA [Serratia quinivorans]CAI1550332.1 O-acetyltransferase OatA [Serratia quinivorans]
MENVVKETVKNYRRDIDGLRAVAILLVVLYHSGVTFLSGGFIGVDVFFVISGFLIGGIIYTELSNKTFSYGRFYTRRIKRIAPALLVMLLICSILAFFYLSPLELKDFSLFSGSTILSVPNIMLWHKTNYFSPNAELNPLLMTWSLGVEEQFYIFLPIILSIVIKFNKKIVASVAVISIISFVFCVILTKTNPLFSFFMLPTRAWELGMGVMLSIMHREGRFNSLSLRVKEIVFIVGLVFILFAAVNFDKHTSFPGYAAILPVLGSLFIILGNGRISSILLGNRVMVFIGLVSYSWYLWHWPLLSFARLAIDSKLSVYNGLIISSIALFIAYLSYLFVETPFRKGFKFENKKIILGYVIISTLLILPSSIGYLLQGIPQRVNTAVAQAEIDKLERIADPCLVGYGSTSYSKDKSCLANDQQDAVALVGDSHAAALRGGVEQYAKKSNMGVYQLTKASCPMLLGVTRVISSYPSHASECETYNKKVIELITSNEKIKTVIISAFWDSGVDDIDGGYTVINSGQNGLSALASGLNDVIQNLTIADKKIILVMDVPFLNFNAVRAIDNQQIPLRRAANQFIQPTPLDNESTDDYRLPKEKVNTLLTSVAKAQHIEVFNPTKNLCDTAGCKFKSNNRPLYYDDQHLTYLGSAHALNGM